VNVLVYLSLSIWSVNRFFNGSSNRSLLYISQGFFLLYEINQEYLVNNGVP